MSCDPGVHGAMLTPGRRRKALLPVLLANTAQWPHLSQGPEPWNILLLGSLRKVGFSLPCIPGKEAVPGWSECILRAQEAGGARSHTPGTAADVFGNRFTSGLLQKISFPCLYIESDIS